MKTLLTMTVMLTMTAAALAVPGQQNGKKQTNETFVGSRDLDTVIISETGFISLSADGWGSLDPNGLIQVEKPSSGATVRSAFLGGVSTGYYGVPIADNCISLAGNGVSWDATASHPYPFLNYWADVTAIVAPVLNPAAAGVHDLVIDECNSIYIDGVALYVIFDDPEATIVRTAVLAFGSQNPAGDTFNLGFGQPIDVEPGDVIELGLAISYGYQQGSCQQSTISVNGTLISSSAGGNDDGDYADGALITVGGIGDSRDLPADPFFTCDNSDYTFYDDELYDVVSFVNDGDVALSITTNNPSNNDNIFAAHLLLDYAAVIGEGAVLTPAFDVNCLGDPHTVTVSLQDDLGDPVVGRDVQIDVVSGPNSGLSSGVLVTNGNGQASYTYTSFVEGTDNLLASFLDVTGAPQTSNLAIKYWERCVVEADELPMSFALSQNHPNPFNPATTIDFSLAGTGMVNLTVFDLAGGVVATLVNGMLEGGQHSVSFDAGHLHSGVYFYTLSADGFSNTKKMVLLK